jgi:hypothetical protein
MRAQLLQQKSIERKQRRERKKKKGIYIRTKQNKQKTG